ncbi:hypothetical protein [Polymorphospora rubra]|uniref:TM2 domain-containing protein n=1 Tax=Polymorphospora rubra TaxID=338584 RepID=A0A810MW81_9ACTN|nr:hypothetical protein [Polymorphospora rubra]BCJ65292.1 hypothetical protein Prubr_23130 [Polymorphospora rubra]
MTYQQFPEQPQYSPPAANLPTPAPPHWAPPTSVPPTMPYGVIPVVPIAAKSAGAAVALELGLGIFGIFGVGNLYAQQIGLGIALMVSYWVLFWINIFLIGLVIGLVTLPLTWVIYMVVGPLTAARGVTRHNMGMLR